MVLPVPEPPVGGAQQCRLVTPGEPAVKGRVLAGTRGRGASRRGGGGACGRRGRGRALERSLGTANGSRGSARSRPRAPRSIKSRRRRLQCSAEETGPPATAASGPHQLQHRRACHSCRVPRITAHLPLPLRACRRRLGCLPASAPEEFAVCLEPQHLREDGAGP